MATYLIESKKEKAIAAEIEQAIEDGKMPKPPSSGKPAHQCELCGGFTVLQPRCTDCAIATDQWQQVLQMAASEAPIVGYDSTCGMQSRSAWAYDFMMTIFRAWLDAEIQWHQTEYKNLGMLTEIGPRSFDSAAHIYLSAIGVHRLSSKGKSVVIDDMAWYAVALYDFFARLRYPAKFTAPIPDPQPGDGYDYVAEAARVCKKIANDPRGYERAKQREKVWLDARAAALQARGIVFPVHPKQPAILPQQLQSNSEVLEAIAMSNLSVSPERIAEMEEAVKFAIENWINIQARVLFDGYELKQGGFTVMLKHPSHPSGVTVGLTDPTTHKLSFVARRGEIREFMHKVASGMKPSDNPKLPGVMMQAPIPDDVKMTPQLRTLKTMSEESTLWFDIMADDDDRPAA